MKEVLQHFAITNEVGEAQPLRIGFINDSFIVPAKRVGERSYCLQRINHRIFKNVDGLMRNIQLVTNHIREKLETAGVSDVERRVLQLVPTKDGKLYYRTEGGDYWRLYVLVEPATSQEKVTQPVKRSDVSSGNWRICLLTRCASPYLISIIWSFVCRSWMRRLREL